MGFRGLLLARRVAKKSCLLELRDLYVRGQSLNILVLSNRDDSKSLYYLGIPKRGIKSHLMVLRSCSWICVQVFHLLLGLCGAREQTWVSCMLQH